MISLDTYGPAITNPSIAESIYNRILKMDPMNSAVTIDLKGIEAMTTQCAKIIFGQLYIVLGADLFYSNVEIKNCSEGLQLVIEFGIEHALSQSNTTLS